MLELLGTSNLEIRILSTAIAANVLSFSDSLLLTNEDCIDAFSDCMEDLLGAAKRYVARLPPVPELRSLLALCDVWGHRLILHC